MLIVSIAAVSCALVVLAVALLLLRVVSVFVARLAASLATTTVFVCTLVAVVVHRVVMIKVTAGTEFALGCHVFEDPEAGKWTACTRLASGFIVAAVASAIAFLFTSGNMIAAISSVVQTVQVTEYRQRRRR
jgi:hypothetical protein